jgi:catechol 2,3-dioxygenase-like lactoylglutathione lyase family enzyme
MIDHVNALVLAVRDVEKCAKFYRDRVGFTLLELQEESAFLRIGEKGAVGGTILALLSMKTVSDLISTEQVRPTEESVHRTFFAVFLDDVDHEYEELTKKGVHFVKPPKTQPWGQRIAYFEDPEGNLWEISQFPKE